MEQNKTIPMGIYEGEFLVKPIKKLRLSISGENLITVNRNDLKSGVIMLPIIQLTITQTIGWIF